MAVYFIRAGETGPVKIGVAKNIRDRMRDMQSANHAELLLVRTIDGGRPQERLLHAHFKHIHIRGEWFKFDPEMLTVNANSLKFAQVDVPETLLLRDIDDFLLRSQMSQCEFGGAALGIYGLVGLLRRGMTLKREQRDRVYQFVASHSEAA